MGTLIENKFGIFRRYLETFISFTDEEWQIFQSHLRFKNLRKKESFFPAYKVCNEIGFIVSGVVRYYVVKDGNEITNYFSFANEMVSSYKSFLTRKPGQTTLQALEDTELITLSYDAMQELYNHPLLGYKMERFGRLTGEYLACCYEDRVLSFVTQTPEERYLQLMENGKAIIQNIPQHYIANFLGITPVSLSRIRKRILEPANK
jgi:CRP-like cAMP-binding protein